MASLAASANNPLLVSRNTLFFNISKGLRNAVGRGKRYSVKELSNYTGVPDRAIECAKCEPDSPDWRPLTIEQVVSLSSFLGPDFTNEWLSLAAQGAFWLPDEETPPGELAADNADDNAKIARAASDRVFDNGERPELKIVGARMMSRGAELVKLGAAA